MRIWLLKLGEPVPVTEPGERLLRMGMLAEMLAARGHEVVWWTSTMNHARRRSRADQVQDLMAAPNYRIVLLHGPSYATTRSPRRYLHHRAVTAAFRRRARDEPEPDIILCAFPLIELAEAAAAYATPRGIPLVLDIRDLWPDIFLEMVPPFLHGPARLALASQYAAVGRAVRAATAVTGITGAAIDWALAIGERARGLLDRPFLHAYAATAPAEADRQAAERFWAAHGLGAGPVVGCFVGTMTARNDVASVIAAARLLPSDVTARLRLVLAGDGETMPALRAAAAGCPVVLLPGWIDRAQIWSLCQRADFGLLSYLPTGDFLRSIPNKVGEYMSAGLPVLSSVGGEMASFLGAGGGGLLYPHGNAPALAALLTDLVRAPERLHALSIQARDQYERHLSAERVYASYCDYLESLARAPITLRHGE